MTASVLTLLREQQDRHKPELDASRRDVQFAGGDYSRQGWPRRASGRKERLCASGLTRTFYYAHARVSAAAPLSLCRGAALCSVHASKQMMAYIGATSCSVDLYTWSRSSPDNLRKRAL